MTYTPYRQDELKALKLELSERGVVDIKIDYNPNHLKEMDNAVAELERVNRLMIDDLITFTRAMLDGKTTPATPIGDSVRGEPKE